MNAGDLALQDRGTYVEGFALSLDGGSPMHHAWLSLDGTNAVDVTWRSSARDCPYFGIPFSITVLEHFMRRTKSWGPLLAGDEQEKVLREAGLLVATDFQAHVFP
jgi:hypothetical protein